jgi:lipid-A-disaccharide synthase
MGELAARPTILLSAGEASGDRYAARLAGVLERRLGARLVGLAGPRMRAAGVEAVGRVEEVSVVGATEVVRRLPRLRAVARKLAAELERRPCLAVLVDYPGFHLRLAARARRLGVPVLYYVGPQVWAWWKGRLSRMARVVDHAAVVFPFEVPLYEAAGIPVTYVGHPIAEELSVELSAAAVRERAGLAPGTPYLALLPGSREEEVRRLLPLLLSAWRLLARQNPRLAAVVAAATDESAQQCAEITRASGVACPIVAEATHSVVAHARAAAVASGTATLETAALGTPLAIVYRVSPLTWLLAKLFVRVRRVGLPNIVAGEDVAPELLQDAATPERLAAALRPLLAEGPERRAMLEDLAKVRASLGEPGTAERVAVLAESLCREGTATASRLAASA